MFIASLLFTATAVMAQTSANESSALQSVDGPLTTVQIQVKPVPPTERRPTPYHPDFEGLLVRMEIGGREGWAILDNTAPHSVVDIAFARAAGLSLSDASGGVTFGALPTDAATEQAAWKVAPTSLVLPGQLEFTGVPLGSLDLSVLTRGDQHVDAVIGRDLLDNLAIGIDPTSHAISFGPGGSARPLSGGMSLPFSGWRVPIKVGDVPLQVTLGLSTPASLSLTPAAWERVRPEGVELESRSIVGFDGASRTIDYGRLPEFAFGTLKRPEIDVAVVSWGAERADGMIGSKFLDQFITLIDAKQGRIWFIPRVVESGEP